MNQTVNDTHRAPVVDTNELAKQLRPAWTPVNIGLMVVFFATGFWPLGLAMIFYMAYGREMGVDLSNWGAAKRSGSRMMSSFGGAAQAKTGNAAFDDWREQELERLNEERRKLDEARAEFDEYVRELRRARDREEFEAFRSRQTVDGEAHSPRADG